MDWEPKKYTIGQMAELCNISKKQLRYYDQNQILSPNYRNPENNYRFYTDNQIEEILLLQELKSLDFPLKDIGKMLDNRGLAPLQHVLEERLYTLREEMEVAQQKYNLTMDILLRVTKGMIDKNPMVNHGEIELVDFPARRVLFTRYISPWNAKNLFISRRAELFKLAEELNVKMMGANMAVFHSGYMKQFSDEPEDSEGDLEVCMSIMDQSANLPNSRIMGPFKAVSCLFNGHYRNMMGTYQAMEEWADMNGHELMEEMAVEEYLIGATMTNNSDDYVTRLYLPLKGFTV